MVTFKILILPHQKKSDGTIFIRIRITHNKQSKYIKTQVLLEKGEYTASGKIKNEDKVDMVKETVKKMKAVVNQIDLFELEEMDVDQVARIIEQKMKDQGKFTLDFYEFGMKVAEGKSKGNSCVYRTAMNALLRFFKGVHPDISEITVKKMREFEQFISNEKVVKVNWRHGTSKEIEKSKKGGRAASLYIGAIRHVYNCARLEYNEPDLGIFKIPVDIFEYYSVPKIPASKHRDIPKEYIQMMIDQRENLTGRMRMSVDAFLISFALMGMNAADMFLSEEKPKRNIIHYFRAKTTNRRDDQAEMYVRIEKSVKQIVKQYLGKERLFVYHKMYANKDVFTTALNQGLSRWITLNKLKKFTFYSARHTWGTMAGSKDANVDAGMITEGLCHADSMNKMDRIYVRKDWEKVWDANAKVLSLLDWE